MHQTPSDNRIYAFLVAIKNLGCPSFEVMVGLVVSHYRIESLLDSGGMGVVYRAEDTRLKRPVAIKFLPQRLFENELALKRFEREARAAASLSHPHICVVHDVGEYEGQPYLVMELLEGETLQKRLQRGPLEEKEALQVTHQVSGALQAAHSRGIIHRDIKPGNIFITKDGFAKVLDFGLAKHLSEEDQTAGESSSTLTSEGTRLGTLTYMSPEQLRGQELDFQTDIFSFGIVIFEMVTGVHPFRRESVSDTTSAILNENPAPMSRHGVDPPGVLNRLVQNMLAKERRDRPRSMSEVSAELAGLTADSGGFRHAEKGRSSPLTWRVAAAVLVLVLAVSGLYLNRDALFQRPTPEEPAAKREAPAKRSIAVLPLDNLTGDPAQEYFVDGMTEALTTELSRLQALRVIARTSAMRYKVTDKSAAEIAAELGVDVLIEGSVLRSGDEVRITTQLIDGKTEEHLWVDSFDRELTSILELHNEVAQTVAREIQVAVTPEEERQLSSARKVDPAAYEAYLKGLYHYNQWTIEGFEKAITFFELALEADATYVPAYAAYVSSQHWLVWTGVQSASEASAKFEEPLRKALEIEPKNHEIVLAKADTSFYFDWNWAQAEKEYRQAIQLNPSYAQGHAFFAWFLMAMGHSAEAIQAAEQGLRLDPLAVSTRLTLGEVYYNSHQFEKAIDIYKQCIDLDPNDPAPYQWLSTAYEQTGQMAEAASARQKYKTLSGAPIEEVEALGKAFSEGGARGYWLWRLAELKERAAPYTTGEMLLRLGDQEKAIEWLETAYRERHTPIVLLKVSPALDSLRGNPRFQDLLKRMRFPD